MTGHSYIVYGPLANGATSVMYEGAPDYPDKDVWWAIVERYGVTKFYTAPTAIRACMKWGVEHPRKHDLSSLQLLGSVGEPINPKAWAWYHEVIGGGRCPIVDTWWQTETGHILISPLPGVTATKPGSATTPLPRRSTPPSWTRTATSSRSGQGYLVLREPWPGMLRTLYGDDERFKETYFEKYGPETYLVGDAARARRGRLLLGRSAGSTTSSTSRGTGSRLPRSSRRSSRSSTSPNAPAIGRADEDTGQAIVAFVTLEGEAARARDELEQQIRDHVGERIGKFARPKEIIWSADLPKTRSGKIMRRLLRDIAEGDELGDVTTLKEPGVMSDLEAKVRAGGGDD